MASILDVTGACEGTRSMRAVAWDESEGVGFVDGLRLDEVLSVGVGGY